MGTSNTIRILAGTKKGLFILESENRREWNLRGPFHPGREINHAVYDPRNGRVLATANDAWFGCEIVWSDDWGANWTSSTRSPQFPESSGTKLDRIWHIEPGGPDEKDVLYAGVAPAALFKSEDKGATWTEVESLSEHPTRPHWHPGAGGLCLHSIVVDSTDSNRVFAGISAVGVFRTEDKGQTWVTANRGTRAEFLPDKYPEYGQCVHKLLMGANGSGVLYQQNHCGVYRSEDAGRSWTEISQGLPSDFGFPLALHPTDPNTLYVLPLKGGEFRCPPEGKLRVFRSRDKGATWSALTAGLPQEEVYCGVYREGMCVDKLNPAGIYFGTNTGKLYASDDEGESWRLTADNLPPIYSVSAAG